MSLSETVKQSASASAGRRLTSQAQSLDELRLLSTETLKQLQGLRQLPESVAGQLEPIVATLDAVSRKTAANMKQIEAARAEAVGQVKATRKLLDKAREELAKQQEATDAAIKKLEEARSEKNGLLWLVLLVSVVSLVMNSM